MNGKIRAHRRTIISSTMSGPAKGPEHNEIDPDMKKATRLVFLQALQPDFEKIEEVHREFGLWVELGWNYQKSITRIVSFFFQGNDIFHTNK